MKRLLKLLPAASFFAMLFVVMTAGILQKDKTYSVTENRMLQKFPKFSVKKVIKGKFQKKYERYLSDQFLARDLWVKLETASEKAFGKTDANGVYFGKDGYLLEKYTEKDFSTKRVDKNIDVLVKFVKKASKTADTKVMIVPSKTYTLDCYLPAFAETYNEELFYSKLNKKLPDNTIVPIFDILYRHKEEYIFYRTDHHWTIMGAWYGYAAYLKSYGKSTQDAKKKKKFKKVSDSFLGTTYSKVNMYTKKDVISIYEPESNMKVIYNLGEKIEDTFYQMKYIEEKDKYSIFFGGNQAVLEISGGEKNNKTLLLIKDSFANCIIPFLAEDYEKIVVVDMRHLNVDLSVLLNKFKPTDVLVLYNTIQFMQDKEFAIKGGNDD